MAQSPKIGFIGIGLMGLPMVRALLRAGFAVEIWNRTAAKADPLRAGGATIADTAADCARGADVLITMLENGGVVGAVLDGGGVAEALRPGAVMIDMSSIRPDEARVHAAMLEARGVAHLDAPVSGGTVGAEEARLAIMAGGPEAVFAQALPVLEAMGRPLRVGPSGAGQIAKLANQMIVAITIGAVAEALVFAERAGADAAQVREALQGGFAQSRILDLHGARMVARDFATRGRTSIQIKDLENGLHAAAGAGAALPFTETALGLFRDLLTMEGDVDHAGLWLTLDALAER